jgi:hypothetical protein
MIAFVVSMQRDLPLLISGFFIAVAGAFMPAIGSMIRARWAAIAEGTQLRTAFAMESTIDEFDWAIGPLLTAALAAAVDPAAPLIAAAIFTVVFGLSLAALRYTQPEPKRRSANHRHRGSLMRDGLPIVVVTLAGLGIMFGAYEVAIPAFALEQGAPDRVVLRGVAAPALVDRPVGALGDAHRKLLRASAMACIRPPRRAPRG